jgi:Helicase HerA, central domain
MGTLHIISAPPPALYVVGDRPPVANAYFAIKVEAAVNLLEAREYRGFARADRLSKAQSEQQRFLNAIFDPGLGMALDLRIAVNPGAPRPLSMALLGRVWGETADGVTARATDLRKQVAAAMPRHVVGKVVEDDAGVARLLVPFAGTAVDSAVITRSELIGLPSRQDAGVSYYFSATPFTWSENDWAAVYAALAASPVPVVLSVAVLPMLIPASFRQVMVTLANFYGRLAREEQLDSGLYYGRRKLAPDAFAVDAEQAFQDYSSRFSHKAFALRIQVSAAKQLPPGLVDTIAGVISPAEGSGATYDVRRPSSAAERRLAEYNLNVINFGMLTGRKEIWNRPDPPDPQLAMLSVLGDARDAACAFRFPIAVDGTVPGFTVRQGQLGPATATYQVAGPVIRLGKPPGTDHDVGLPTRSLTRPALIVGSAGTGKTTTALEVLRQLWAEHKIPFLVIDPANVGAGDYRKLAAEPGFTALEVITVGDESGRPLRFNPFEVPAGVLVGEHAANLLVCLTAAFALSGPLPFIYQDALNLTYLRAGFLSSERSTGTKRDWPTVVEFMTAMREVSGGLGYTGDVKASIEAATVRRAEQLVRGVAGSAFLTDQPNQLGRLLDHPVLVELKSLGAGGEQALVMALLLNAITEHCQWVRGASPDLVHVTLVEEAHRLLTRAAEGRPAQDERARHKAAEVFANTLAANRRFGEGVIIAEQFPAKLVADVVKGSSLKVVHRLTAEEDRRYLGATMGMDEAERLLAARLDAGEALLFSEEIGEATHVRIPRTPRAAALPADVVPPTAAPPFSACDRCRAQCTYRGAALSMVNDPGIATRIRTAVAALEEKGTTPGENEARWSALIDGLLTEVGAFPALPSTAPERSDAAYCLFLHALASRTMRFAPSWPAAVADRLHDDSGPADSAAQPGVRSGVGGPIATDMTATRPAEPGELGPAADPLAGDTGHGGPQGDVAEPPPGEGEAR